MYLPAAHKTHTVPFPVAPPLQVQFVTDMLDTGELAKLVHDTQVLEPDTLAYVFTGQSTQLGAKARANFPGKHF